MEEEREGGGGMMGGWGDRGQRGADTKTAIAGIFDPTFLHIHSKIFCAESDSSKILIAILSN